MSAQLGGIKGAQDGLQLTPQHPEQTRVQGRRRRLLHLLPALKERFAKLSSHHQHDRAALLTSATACCKIHISGEGEAHCALQLFTGILPEAHGTAGSDLPNYCLWGLVWS